MAKIWLMICLSWLQSFPSHLAAAQIRKHGLRSTTGHATPALHLGSKPYTVLGILGGLHLLQSHTSAASRFQPFIPRFGFDKDIKQNKTYKRSSSWNIFCLRLYFYGTIPPPQLLQRDLELVSLQISSALWIELP